MAKETATFSYDRRGERCNKAFGARWAGWRYVGDGQRAWCRRPYVDPDRPTPFALTILLSAES